MKTSRWTATRSNVRIFIGEYMPISFYCRQKLDNGPVLPPAKSLHVGFADGSEQPLRVALRG